MCDRGLFIISVKFFRKVQFLKCNLQFCEIRAFYHYLPLQWKDEVVDVAMKMLQPVHPGVEADLPLMQQYQVRLGAADTSTKYGLRQSSRCSIEEAHE